jgi:hypothetical protein
MTATANPASRGPTCFARPSAAGCGHPCSPSAMARWGSGRRSARCSPRPASSGAGSTRSPTSSTRSRSRPCRARRRRWPRSGTPKTRSTRRPRPARSPLTTARSGPRPSRRSSTTSTCSWGSTTTRRALDPPAHHQPPSSWSPWRSYAAPQVSGLSPAHGSKMGGTVVTISGSRHEQQDAAGPTACAGSSTETELAPGSPGRLASPFDGVPATDYVVNSDSTITATSPANTSAGAADVQVTVPGGQSACVGRLHLRHHRLHDPGRHRLRALEHLG